MCGIAGLAWKDTARPAGLDELRAMTAAQAHRGPDGAGEWAEGPVALGHRRLSIIDLSEQAGQPMASAGGALVVVYNGEIYNFVELRAELAQHGATFATDSDTEVLLHAYRVWGQECVQRFNGMWAFAIHDRDRGEVFLSRDRFGIKPLCYVDDARRFAFASEMKALVAAFPDLREADAAFLARFLPTGALDDGPETVFARIRQLPPAHNAVYTIATGTLRLHRYWDVEPGAFAAGHAGADPVEVLRGLLDSAIALQMRADVPVGTCLSGGIDSSTIVCWMSGLRPDPVRTFSALYRDPGCDESRYVEAVRRHSGCMGADIRPEPTGDFVDDLATITWHQDTPTAGPSLYTQFNVMARACYDVKVILDGQGGDELFAGYLPYYGARIRDLLGSGGWRERREAAALAATIAWHWAPGVLSRLPLPGALTRRIPRLARAGAAPAILHADLARLAAARPTAQEPPAKYGDRLGQALFRDLVERSIPALLHYEDRNAMAFGVEARVPLLDHRIVEFALGLDAGWKIRDTWTKWVLRKAAEPKLPRVVTWRRSKMGYPTPAARWMRQGRDRDALHELLFSPRFLARGLVAREGLEACWKQHQEQGIDRSGLLYRCATTELWYRHFIDAFAPQPARGGRAASQPAAEVATAA